MVHFAGSMCVARALVIEGRFPVDLEFRGHTPLTKSLLCGQVRDVRFYLQHGADPNRAVAGCQPLVAAMSARSKVVERCRLLLLAGARVDPGLFGPAFQDVLHLASQEKKKAFCWLQEAATWDRLGLLAEARDSARVLLVLRSDQQLSRKSLHRAASLAGQHTRARAFLLHALLPWRPRSSFFFAESFRKVASALTHGPMQKSLALPPEIMEIVLGFCPRGWFIAASPQKKETKGLADKLNPEPCKKSRRKGCATQAPPAPPLLVLPPAVG